ncbi:MAG: sodium:proton antiporter [Herpetosiphonaceae bacterium]|nr:sodium:proton antiporter [Herpetosiphonaceae bacterium]
MSTIYWYIIIGTLLLGVTVAGTLLKELPVSTSIVYLGVGFALGPHGLGLISWDLVREADFFELLTELAVIASLFTVGLNLRRSLGDRSWWLPVRLASITMILTIAGIAMIGVFLLDLPLGAAILLGAVLAPTDPVLASDVQIKGVTDRDTLRYSLSGEAGLNDGTAFPFVMLGLGLLALHPDEYAGLAGLWGERSFSLLGWLGWDLLWAVGTGLLVGAATGWLTGKLMLKLGRSQADAFSLQAFLVLGLIALAYGLAELVYGYGFLAVFAAGYALRYLELHMSQHSAEPPALGTNAPDDDEEVILEAIQTPEETAHYLTISLGKFNNQLEHLFEAGVVVLLGGVLTTQYLSWDVLWFAPLLFLVLRPATVAIGLWHSDTGRVQRLLTGWFGIRGIGSIYYLSYAINHGLPTDLAIRLTSLVLSTIAVSIIVHGISVTPLMNWYERLVKRRSHQRDQPAAEEVKV